jgi:hypothetical protein
LFRGTKYFKDKTTHTQREDRNPMDSKYEVQMATDDYFYSKFGWRPRTEGLFAIPVYRIARDYAKDDSPFCTHMVFPNGNFKYVWSSQVNDFYSAVSSRSTVKTQADKYLSGDKYDFEITLKSLKYTDTGLDRITTQEVMIKASSFTLVNCVYYLHYCTHFNIKPDMPTLEAIYSDLLDY